MSHTNDQYIKIKDESEQWLFQIPGVFGVGLGPKMSAGKLTGELAIQVYVEKKRALQDLSEEEIIPSYIKDVVTDVIEGDPFIETLNGNISDCQTNKIKNLVPNKDQTKLIITSPSHGLLKDDEIRIFGLDIAIRALKVDETKQDTFTLPGVYGEKYVENSAIWVKISKWDRIQNVLSARSLCCCPRGRITSATAANPVVITTESGHGLHKGDKVWIDELTGMTEINKKIFTVGKVNGKTFQLKGEDGTGHTEATNESGRWTKICLPLTGRITNVIKDNPVKIKSPAHGLSDNDKVRIIGVWGTTEINNNGLDDKGKESEPHKIICKDPNTFELKDDKNNKIDGSNFGNYEGGGIWMRLPREDKRGYNPLRGGLSLEMDKTKVTGGYQPTTKAMAGFKLTTKISGDTIRNTGTIGCIAIDNKSKKKVILSNHHVLFSEDKDGDPVHEDVHHPNFDYWISKSCCNNKVGERLRDRCVYDPNFRIGSHHVGIDAAIAKLEPNVRTVPEILDIGTVSGTVEVKPDEVAKGDYRVWKRGGTTHLTEGILVATNFSSRHPIKDGLLQSSSPGDLDTGNTEVLRSDFNRFNIKLSAQATIKQKLEGERWCEEPEEGRWCVIDGERQYEIRKTSDGLKVFQIWRNQLRIVPLAGRYHGIFSSKGDSGSVVVNSKNEIVGLLWSGGNDGVAIATPIKAVESALNIKVWSQSKPNGSEDSGENNSSAEGRDSVALSLPDLFEQTTKELLQSEAGSQIVGMIPPHFHEVQSLINTNKKFALAWHRNEGPAIIRTLRQVIEARDVPMPTAINNRPLIDCFNNIFALFKEFGSTRLTNDLTRYAPFIGQLGGKSYMDMLGILNAGNPVINIST
jgi:hypothetical protein